nr:MAG TPA: hypothetical protein [Caudoviricetes sp.]
MILITSILFTLTNLTHHDIVCYSMIYFCRANYVLPTLICMWGRGPWLKSRGLLSFYVALYHNRGVFVASPMYAFCTTTLPPPSGRPKYNF